MYLSIREDIQIKLSNNKEILRVLELMRLIWIWINNVNLDFGSLDTKYAGGYWIWFTWRYLSCRAEQLSAMTLLAAARDLEAFCSPSAAITWKNPSFFWLIFSFQLPLPWPPWQPLPLLPWPSVAGQAVWHPYCKRFSQYITILTLSKFCVTFCDSISRLRD